MTNQEIDNILSESGNLCLSVIIPTNRLAPERIKDRKKVQDAIKHAKELLKEEHSTKRFDIDSFNRKLDEAFLAIDFNHTKEGIGIYVSQNTAQLVSFPFPVVEKVKIDTVFDNRDLLYLRDVISEYMVLTLSHKDIHLYHGKGEDLTESINVDFPSVNKETYEYSKPSRGTSYSSGQQKEFERDKSVMEENRMVAFFRSADKLLPEYTGTHLPLIIAGGDKEVAGYLNITTHGNRIIGKINGSYANNGELQLAKHAWQQVCNYRKIENQALLKSLRELLGNEMAAIGLEEVYMVAARGMGLELLVEKDLESPGYIAGNGMTLHLSIPANRTKYLYVSDAVERIIRLTREKGGKVTFADPGELGEFNGIAMRLRYNENPV